MPKRRDVLRGLAAVVPLALLPKTTGAVPNFRRCKLKGCQNNGGQCPEGFFCDLSYGFCRQNDNPCSDWAERPFYGCGKKGKIVCCTSPEDRPGNNDCVSLKKKP